MNNVFRTIFIVVLSILFTSVQGAKAAEIKIAADSNVQGLISYCQQTGMNNMAGANLLSRNEHQKRIKFTIRAKALQIDHYGVGTTPVVVKFSFAGNYINKRYAAFFAQWKTASVFNAGTLRGPPAGLIA